jgi:hypothetical protein
MLDVTSAFPLCIAAEFHAEPPVKDERGNSEEQCSAEYENTLNRHEASCIQR